MGTEFPGSELTLGQGNALVKKLGGMDNVRKILSGTVKVTIEEIKESILQIAATVTLAARTQKFEASKELSVGNHDGLKIAYQGGNFETWFAKKVEEPSAETTMVVRKLTKGTRGTGIVQELGGEENAETTLSDLHALLKKQGEGQKGDLLTDGSWNIFHIRDVNGILRVVNVSWGDFGGWHLCTRLTSHPCGWDAGSHVFSRK